MTGYPVQTTDLGVNYGRTTALSGVTVTLEAGRIHGLLGRNGAGKSTLMAALASLRDPAAGQIRIDGQEPFENQSVMENVCLIRESGDCLSDEKITVNLDFVEAARPHFDRAFAEHLLGEFGLDPKKRPDKLSRGQASAFGAVVGLASRAPVTMFDEVHLGMDAPSRQLFYDTLLTDFAEHPRTILLSSHLISEIEQMLETVTILHEGQLLLTEESDTMRGRGATLTGPTAAVDRHSADLTVVGSRDLGPTRQVTLYGDLDENQLAAAERDGLQVGPVPLQDLFIHLTNTRTAQEAS